MREWPLTIRASGLAERVCVHSCGHPDPDSLGYYRERLGPERYARLQLGTHGCDGCCVPRPDIPAAFVRAFEGSVTDE